MQGVLELAWDSHVVLVVLDQHVPTLMEADLTGVGHQFAGFVLHFVHVHEVDDI